MHAGGPPPDMIEVGAELGEFRRVGVQDPAVWRVGFLPAAQSCLLAPVVDGAEGAPSSAARSASHHSLSWGAWSGGLAGVGGCG
jgi:hypothetical protein